MNIRPDNLTNRTTPIPIFMSRNYRELLERLHEDYILYGGIAKWDDILEALKKYQYSTDLAMHSEALEIIEDTIKYYINYPNT